jgi:transposase-like protein
MDWYKISDLMIQRNLVEIICQNPNCYYFGKEEGKHIIKWGKNHAGHQRYRCGHCKMVFVETKSTHLYNIHMSGEDIKLIYMFFMRKKTIREIAESTGHHRDTIRNLRDAMLKAASN